jgi:hypothetical protein
MNMHHTQASRQIGRVAALALFFIGVTYAITLVAGFVSLKSPQVPILDTYFSLMEVLIFISAPLLVALMVAVHAYAARDDKVYSLTALAFMILSAGLTASIHFVVLVASRQVEFRSLSWLPLFLAFKWPSLVYILDILAWDVFYGLSMLFAASVFKGGRLQTAVRITMAVSGVFSIAGLIFLPFGDIQLRMIGIVGYAGLGPVSGGVLVVGESSWPSRYTFPRSSTKPRSRVGAEPRQGKSTGGFQRRLLQRDAHNVTRDVFPFPGATL